ncbi:hypothetical protein [Nonomuraea sp. NPDC048901]|uniref:hypothetical protein n=1 Tax=Nonomuraea sp. NPDC048901 TaxID=3155627 RepID=UPI0033FF84F4
MPMRVARRATSASRWLDRNTVVPCWWAVETDHGEGGEPVVGVHWAHPSGFRTA